MQRAWGGAHLVGSVQRVGVRETGSGRQRHLKATVRLSFDVCFKGSLLLLHRTSTRARRPQRGRTEAGRRARSPEKGGCTELGQWADSGSVWKAAIVNFQ